MFFAESKIFASDGNANYRIPSVITTKHGTVIAFCTNRIGTLKDHADEIDLVCSVKKSGEPWGEVRVLAHVPNWACNIGSAVYDDVIDRVIVFFSRNPVAKNEFGKYTPEELAEMERRRQEIIREAERDGIFAGWRRLISDDDGEHFVEEAHKVVPALQTHWDGSIAPVEGSTHGAAHGICLRHGVHAGRLLCPSRTAIGSYSDWEI